MNRVLVVDDDPSIRELIGALLAPESFDVRFAEDGAEAVERARAEQPDLIILDIMMPMMDGLEACRQLKADPVTGGIPVLMLTARTGFDDRVEAEDAKAEAYLTKPFSPFTLTKMIEHLLDVKATRAEG